jgi:AraC-like DNA-binding protein
MSADALSDAMRRIRINGAAFFDVTLRAPWVLAAPSSDQCAPYVMPGASHVIEYHVVASGQCWGGLVDDEPIRLREGDVLIFPQGDAHVLSSEPRLRGVPDIEVYKRSGTPQLPVPIIAGSGDGDAVQIVCGFLGYDATLRNPLIGALPRVIHAPAHARPAGSWLDRLIPSVVAECKHKRPGGEDILERLSELMFVETLRQYIETLPPAERGWLGGLRDKTVGRALNLIHSRPAHDWTVEELAREVGSSRSVLGERFNEFLGHPPIQYLINWRMQLAMGLLSEGSSSIAQIAGRVGYESEAAFSRAFKRSLLQAPSAWRSSQRRALAAV